MGENKSLVVVSVAAAGSMIVEIVLVVVDVAPGAVDEVLLIRSLEEILGAFDIGVGFSVECLEEEDCSLLIDAILLTETIDEVGHVMLPVPLGHQPVDIGEILGRFLELLHCIFVLGEGIVVVFNQLRLLLGFRGFPLVSIMRRRLCRSCSVEFLIYFEDVGERPGGSLDAFAEVARVDIAPLFLVGGFAAFDIQGEAFLALRDVHFLDLLLLQ